MTGRMPSYVMFSDLKRFGRMSHYDAARVLLSDTVAEGEQVFHLKRVRTANGTPIMLENTFFPCSFGDIDAEAFEHASLFDVIENATGHRITESPTTTLEIVKTTSEQANQLDIVTGEPLFYMHVYFTDAQGTPLVIGRQYIVGSLFIFSI